MQPGHASNRSDSTLRDAIAVEAFIDFKDAVFTFIMAAIEVKVFFCSAETPLFILTDPVSATYGSNDDDLVPIE